jgi:DNA-binding response OmpR family regulator
MTVLIVEDDERIASFLVKGLRAEGYAVAPAQTGQQATHLCAELGEDLDLILLDIGLPDTDGISLLQTWRAQKITTPILILTARDSTPDKIEGLDAGANDYITKPFAFDELLARVRAALRTPDQNNTTQLTIDDLHLDLLTKIAWRNGRRIDLAPREWALLELFMRHPNQVLTRTQILNRVWDYGFDPGSNIVDVYVGYVRRKLNRPNETPLLQTVRGAGYRLREPRGCESIRDSR